jgi:hypothetical protein
MPGQQSTTAPRGRPAHPPSPLQPIDQRIVVVRQDLESVFTELETILDVCITVHTALETTRTLLKTSISLTSFSVVVQIRCMSSS